MVDIHCHILCGLDDGAENIAESVEMAKIACDGGSSFIVATPHSNMSDIYKNPWGENIVSKIVALNKALTEKGIDLRILPGQEIYCGDHAVEKLKNGQLITLIIRDIRLLNSTSIKMHHFSMTRYGSFQKKVMFRL